ncbi:symmetrical bis(5'-nucleosyl)-tetraphosphatase [Thiohalorhabdus sp.]|uniref:symmetrical bis(5'-nucleosyl)-tetraphosphatase n=1 Tax=Thiohalorhabdus sp. TaxID=3094134 RepID=UPI002FC3C6FA
MAVYAIGDIQGCGAELEALLENIAFDPGRDRLWLVGDLVNRGPRSLEVLRRVRALGEAAKMVLGNHDLHLIGRALSEARPKGKDTLAETLEAPDAAELMDWLRHRPLFHRDPGLGWNMVHAALHPLWDLATAEGRAQSVESALRGPDGGELAASLSSSDLPTREPDPSDGWQWLRFNAAVLTRTRFCTADGEFAWSATPPDERYRPWYAHRGRAAEGRAIVYGHWAAAGFTRSADTLGLDSGCVWGGALTGARLDPDGAVGGCWHQDCPGYWKPEA